MTVLTPTLILPLRGRRESLPLRRCKDEGVRAWVTILGLAVERDPRAVDDAGFVRA